MAQGDKPTEALKSVRRQIYEAVGNTATELHAELKRVAPVDTGLFKVNWRMYKNGETSWRIYNNTAYAAILWRGRDTFDGNGYETGSHYWPAGGDPMLAKADAELSRTLERIKE